MASGLEIGFELDRLWHLLRGEMDQTKKPALLALADVFEKTGVPYAIIGGVAAQVRMAEPRTTIDIDVAIKRRDDLPRGALEAAGFRHTGEFPYTSNWVGPGGVAVQFSDDPTFGVAIDSALPEPLEGRTLRIITAGELLQSKLRSAAEPRRRPSKRMRDIADVMALIEENPELDATLTDEQRHLLEQTEVPVRPK